MKPIPPGLDGKLVAFLDRVNSQIMRSNEMDLARSRAIVDFSSAGSLPDRVAGLGRSFAEGFRILGSEMIGFSMAAFPKAGDMLQGDQIVTTLGGESPPHRSIILPRDDEYIASLTRSNLLKRLERAGERAADYDDFAWVELIYFVREADALNEEEFNVESAVEARWKTLGPSVEGDIWWPPCEQFLQRLSFILVFKREGFDEFFRAYGNGLEPLVKHQVGAFLSTLGLSTDEASNLHTQRVAAHVLLRSHELANDFRFLNVTDGIVARVLEGRKLTTDDQDALRELSVRLKRALSNCSAIIGGDGESPMTTPTFWRTAFDGWLVGSHVVEDPRNVGQGPWRGIPGRARTPVEWEFSLKTNDALDLNMIPFGEYYFGKLLDNLLRNAQDRYIEWTDRPAKPLKVQLSVSADNGDLVMKVSNSGPPIRPELLYKLFRTRLSDADRAKAGQASKSGGYGLWSLGLALRSNGLSLPQIENTAHGPVFTFRFPVVKHQGSR